MKNPEEDPRTYFYTRERTEAESEADYNNLLVQSEPAYNADLTSEKRWKRLKNVGHATFNLTLFGAGAVLLAERTYDYNANDAIWWGALALCVTGVTSSKVGRSHSSNALRSQRETLDNITTRASIRLERGVTSDTPEWLTDALERPEFIRIKSRAANPPEIDFPDKPE